MADPLYDIYMKEFQAALSYNEANGDGFKRAMIQALQEVFNEGYWEGASDYGATRAWAKD
jgi:hypothetical protein